MTIHNTIFGSHDVNNISDCFKTIFNAIDDFDKACCFFLPEGYTQKAIQKYLNDLIDDCKKISEKFNISDGYIDAAVKIHKERFQQNMYLDYFEYKMRGNRFIDAKRNQEEELPF